MPLELVSCTVVAPDLLSNIAGYSGRVQWQFFGTLGTADDGQVTYQVMVELPGKLLGIRAGVLALSAFLTVGVYSTLPRAFPMDSH